MSATIVQDIKKSVTRSKDRGTLTDNERYHIKGQIDVLCELDMIDMADYNEIYTMIFE